MKRTRSRGALGHVGVLVVGVGVLVVTTPVITVSPNVTDLRAYLVLEEVHGSDAASAVGSGHQLIAATLGELGVCRARGDGHFRQTLAIESSSHCAVRCDNVGLALAPL